MKLKETPFFFPSGSHQMYGVLYEPASEALKQGIVICPPFAEEHLWSQRVFVNFARELARNGHPVLRFDYMGTGDSEGDFEQCSVQTKVMDIRAASDTLRQKVKHVDSVTLLGLRFGASLADLAAEGQKDITRLVLCDPILNGDPYMRGLLRSNIATQSAIYREIRYNTEALIQMMRQGKTVNVEGYEMSGALYEQGAAINLLNGRLPDLERVLLVQISPKQQEISKEYKELQTRWISCDVALAVELPFWKEIKPYCPRADNLYQITINWLKQ